VKSLSPPPTAPAILLQVTYEELQAEAAVKSAAQAAGAQLRSFWANTLCHLEDLPFSLAQLPQNFGASVCLATLAHCRCLAACCAVLRCAELCCVVFCWA
jgi:hypothetical protein